MSTPRPNIEIFNQPNVGQEGIFGHLANQTIIATGTGPHHSLTSSGKGANLLIGAGGANVFAFMTDTTWTGFAAQNVGDPNGAGPNTTFGLAGYAQNKDVFKGQAGAVNILWMADGKKAFFLDDGYSPGVSALRMENMTEIRCGTGDQIVDLTSTQYAVGNITLRGGTGNNVLMANAGNDLLIAGKGTDYLWGGSGNDAFNYEVAKAKPYADQAFGANGVDTLKVVLTAAEYTTAVKAELIAYHNFISNPANNGQSFQFTKIGNLNATGMERLDVNVAGQHVNVVGLAAKQTLHGDTATDSVTGGAGTDTFFWTVADVATGDAVDHVTNFSFQQNDRIDVSRLVNDHKPASIGDVARTVDTAQGTLVQVHVNGSQDWTDVALLDRIHNVTAAELWQSQSLIL